jgi:hypothetical protein
LTASISFIGRGMLPMGSVGMFIQTGYSIFFSLANCPALRCGRLVGQFLHDMAPFSAPTKII